MREAREFAEWSRTAAQLAKMHNLQCAKKSNMKPPAYFHPFMARKQGLAIPLDNPENVDDFAKLAKKAFGIKD